MSIKNIKIFIISIVVMVFIVGYSSINEKYIFTIGLIGIIMLVLFLSIKYYSSSHTHLKILFSFLFFAIYLAIFYIDNINRDREIDKLLKESENKLKLQYSVIQYYNKKDADSMNKLLLNNQIILDILSKVQNRDKKSHSELREELYNILKERFIIMQSKGIDIFMFVLPDNSVFLRMHKPFKFGDDLSDIRYGMKLVNERKKSIHGFQDGKTTHAFRYLYPISDGDKHLGVMGISYSSQNLQDTLTDINKIHTHFLVHKEVLQKKEWRAKNIVNSYSNSVEHSSYSMAVINGVVHKDSKMYQKIISLHREFIDENIANSNKFSIYLDNSIISFIPIESISDSKIPAAYLVSYTKNSKLSDIVTLSSIILVASFSFLLLVSYLLYTLIVKKDDLQSAVDDALSQNIKQLEILQQQTKMAQMGEMIGAIAHQWRQPLNVVSTGIQNLKYDYEDGYLNDEKFVKKFIDKNKKTIEFMSKTIDDFRNFFRVDKQKRDFKVKQAIKSVLDMLSAQLKDKHIVISLKGDEFEFYGQESEYQQVVINIINNAKDILIENKIQNPKIDIVVADIQVTIQDNAGGIPQDILDRVFEPYFTTKEQGKGTGIGLYMSKMIIEENMGGRLRVNNVDDGAKFTIDFSLTAKKEESNEKN